MKAFRLSLQTRVLVIVMLAAVLPIAVVGLWITAGAERVVCCIDARMNEVYHAAYEKCGADWRTVHEPGVYAPDNVPMLQGTDWQACGNGFAVYGDKLSSRYGQRLVGIDGTLHPHAREIAALSAPIFAAGGGMPAEFAAPIYVRDKVALMTHERNLA